ncbi:TlpA family protein disulfide reductase [Sphingomicrobium marinum]|uniref:TlpA family protein disulfide reductase n=1 Tax=Sphingomicrobium marinum TaxID=1227950 RepID=UPI0022400D09|nr:TlpA disulfide reductase family protein [Sphingomicrobium marinum]
MKKLLILAALVLSACGTDPATETTTKATEQTALLRDYAGTDMPDIAVTDPDGEQTTLGEIAGGEPILVNLWASWCAPCVKELPTLLALSERGDVRVLALSQDIGPQPSVRAFLEGHGVGSLGAWQDADMAMTDALPVTIMPTTVLYDAQGKEVWRYVGDLDWSGDEAAALIAELDS